MSEATIASDRCQRTHYNLTDPINAPDDFPVDPDWSDLNGYSRVLVETYRFTAGVDYWVNDQVS